MTLGAASLQARRKTAKSRAGSRALPGRQGRRRELLGRRRCAAFARCRLPRSVVCEDVACARGAAGRMRGPRSSGTARRGGEDCVLALVGGARWITAWALWWTACTTSRRGIDYDRRCGGRDRPQRLHRRLLHAARRGARRRRGGRDASNAALAAALEIERRGRGRRGGSGRRAAAAATATLIYFKLALPAELRLVHLGGDPPARERRSPRLLGSSRRAPHASVAETVFHDAGCNPRSVWRRRRARPQPRLKPLPRAGMPLPYSAPQRTAPRSWRVLDEFGAIVLVNSNRVVSPANARAAVDLRAASASARALRAALATASNARGRDRGLARAPADQACRRRGITPLDQRMCAPIAAARKSRTARPLSTARS